MTVRKLENGNLLVPFGMQLEDGTCVDGMKEVKPGTEEYESWKDFVADDDES